MYLPQFSRLAEPRHQIGARQKEGTLGTVSFVKTHHDATPGRREKRVLSKQTPSDVSEDAMQGTLKLSFVRVTGCMRERLSIAAGKARGKFYIQPNPQEISREPPCGHRGVPRERCPCPSRRRFLRRRARAEAAACLPPSAPPLSRTGACPHGDAVRGRDSGVPPHRPAPPTPPWHLVPESPTRDPVLDRERLPKLTPTCYSITFRDESFLFHSETRRVAVITQGCSTSYWRFQRET